MEVTELRALVVAVLERQPGMVFDLLEVPPPSPPSQGALGWCICGNCRAMPSDEEKLCCRCQPRNCIAKTPVSVHLQKLKEISYPNWQSEKARAINTIFKAKFAFDQ